MCKWKCIHVVSGVCVGRFALCMHTRQDREEGVRCPDILPYFWWRHHMLWPWKANIFSYSMLWRLNVAADRDLYPWSTMDTCTLIFTPTLLTSTCMHFACMHMPAPTCDCMWLCKHLTHNLNSWTFSILTLADGDQCHVFINNRLHTVLEVLVLFHSIIMYEYNILNVFILLVVYWLFNNNVIRLTVY